MALEGEVVGALGRVGSALSRFSSGHLIEVGRSDAIGTSSPANSPIYVCTGVDALEGVLRNTPEERVEDLVIMQNGVLRTTIQGHLASRGLGSRKVTLAVLYFSVLERGGPAKSGGRSYAQGKWAASFSDLLSRGGLESEVITSEAELDARAAEKLMWTSSMWLLCHRHGQRTVGEVHGNPVLVELLHRLVFELIQEILPRLGVLEGGFAASGGHILLGDVNSVVSRMREYSLRISGAVPSRKLALEELRLRNGWFLPAAEAGSRQPTHVELLGLQGVSLGVSGLAPPAE